MTNLFADTVYLIALISPRDSLFNRANDLSQTLFDARIFTTDLVLAEVLNSCAESRPGMRSSAAEFVLELRLNASATVVPATSEWFDSALNLYRHRPDKGWSFTDCLSFLVMERYRIKDALTSDHHFEQAGFKALLR